MNVRVKVLRISSFELKVVDEVLLFLFDLNLYVSVVIFENMAEKYTFKQIWDDIISKGDIGLKGLSNQPIILFLPFGHMEHQSIEHTVRSNQERLELEKEVLTVG